ncbi:MAG: efflux RND transporter periplasmic adaptor subunit [Sulfurimonas sp.]|uniref:efflux RND transporter periplasmic adaptor subunit n=1 Tax=Sulfurimonas sp. TaxID=2022749 RepID=UPI0025DA069A|nr:efflux RND transporter periplasmic adaptor subunit [Sulfurimonas sp.]MCK9491010.1 efflux RND transporter periplasmic adaptor subunit [Sulfurimonas sp.]
MTKIFLLTSVLALTLFAVDIPTKHAKMREFSKSIELNSQIVQLSNAKQSVMSLVGGHIEKYFVKVGQSVKSGEKIALIESIVLSDMTANFISLKTQLDSQEKNFQASKTLYEKGMTSMQELNQESIKRDEALAKLTSLKSQLSTLGINTSSLKRASSSYILYAHSDGIVSQILQPLHSSIKEDTPIILVTKEQAFYLKSFLPLKYGSRVRVGQKIVIDVEDDKIASNVTQILPEVDEKTQRIVLLSSIDSSFNKLYENAYTSAKLYFDNTKSYVAVQRSALSFFNNEWVIFTSKHEQHKEEAHDEHEGHEHEEENEKHTKEVDEHEGHGEEKETPYGVRVVNIVAQDEEFVAVEGLRVGEIYVSDKSYFVKSQLLKSSLGGHGH